MKTLQIFVTLVILTAVATGCGSESAPGYDSASREAAEALAKNGNDITKLTPEQRKALEGAAIKTRPSGGMQSTNGGSGAPAPGAGG